MGSKAVAGAFRPTMALSDKGAYEQLAMILCSREEHKYECKQWYMPYM